VLSDLSSVEKLKLEKLFEMGGGYVLDFTNWTYAEFILENAGIDIYDEKYNYATGSKANRLRQFWKVESNYVVGVLIQDLADYWYTLQSIRGREITTDKQALYDDCKKIAARLLQGSATEYLDAIELYSDERDVTLLQKQILESLRANEPEVALDRLHTYAVKFVRHVCDKHSIEYDQKRPLHALYGQYVKYQTSNGLIESDMTESILKTFIQLLEEFNHVRNKRSLAHDNPILNYNESELIVSGVMVALKFLRTFEEEPSSQGKDEESTEEWDEIPF
jgi:hypothetical protein